MTLKRDGDGDGTEPLSRAGKKFIIWGLVTLQPPVRTAGRGCSLGRGDRKPVGEGVWGSWPDGWRNPKATGKASGTGWGLWERHAVP